MARKRMLHPGFFTSEQVAAVPPLARLTFAGLWVYADDDGRGKDNAALVKAAVWPLDDDVTRDQVEVHLTALAGVGLVCRYTAPGGPLLHVITWREHQRISHPTPSKLPPCPTHEGLASGSREVRESLPSSSSTSAHRAAEVRSVQSSSSTGEEPLPQTPVDNLKGALTAAGLTATWPTATDLVEVERLVRLHGVDRLVASALQRHRPDAPALFVGAWLPGWQALPVPKPRVVHTPCPVHPELEPRAVCGACRSERLERKTS